jgi:4-hydroxy-tetrahydrodipicolinate synthase
MPGTAPEAAKLAGLPFDQNRYRTDEAYNLALGKAYYEKQLRDFGGDERLAAAAYNAGPGAVRSALQKGGPDGWINNVPLETRKYIRSVFGGAGARYVLDELMRGASGTMPASELADVHVALMRAWSSGDRARARALYSRTLPLLLFQAIFRVRATKALLQMRGLLDCTAVRAAGPEFDALDTAEFAALAAEAADLFSVHKLKESA